MAKVNRTFSFEGTFNDMVQVNSKAYGKYMRRPRGTKKPALLNDSFKKSVELNKLANPIAKVIKDALDPFRQNFKDGTMWSRLVGFFKKHLRKNSSIDFRGLENFEIFHKHRLATHYFVTTSVSILRGAETSIRVELSSRASLDLERFQVSSYRQTVIAVLLNADLTASSCSESIILPLERKLDYEGPTKKKPRVQTSVDQKQIAEWPVPTGTKWILIVVKCEPCREGKEFGPVKLKGMRVEKVCEVT